MLTKTDFWVDDFKNDKSCEFAASASANKINLREPNETTKYTHDLNRMAEINCLIYSSIDAHGLEKPDLRLACPTSRWLHAALKSTDIAMNNAKKLKTPLLIVRTMPDEAVDNDGQTEFCELAEKCRIFDVTTVNGVQAGHELLIEQPAIRNKFFDHFDRFVGN